ncbi:hypothetical protein HYR99_26550 [Candidatus Poribacteria bacterium]|nr:hypothetical protein [Candidatus Poribacteria bacterium]
MLVRRILLILVILFTVFGTSSYSSAGWDPRKSIKNTPFDPGTWKKTIENTPLDPGTWKKTIENTPLDPGTWIDTWENVVTVLDAITGGHICGFVWRSRTETWRTDLTLNYTEKCYLRPTFGDLVDKVRVMWNAPLESDTSGETVGYTIYMSGHHDTGDTEQMLTLAHEMVHVWQHHQLGGNMERDCRAYATAHVNGGFKSHNNEFEIQAYKTEFEFAQWFNSLAKSWKQGAYQTYRSQSPYIAHSVLIPVRLNICHQEYAVTWVENRTGYHITYEFQWGNRNWERVVVAPGQGGLLSHPYEGGFYSSPNLNVKFDADMSQGVFYRTYMLQRYRCDSQRAENAKRYYFAIDRQNYLQLQLYDGGN